MNIKITKELINGQENEQARLQDDFDFSSTDEERFFNFD